MTTSKAPFVLDPLPASFGARVIGVDSADLSGEDFQALYDAWLQYGLLIFPGLHFSREQQISFAGRFGPLQIDIADISNVAPDGTIRPADDELMQLFKGNMGWHQDGTYLPVRAKGIMLSAVVTTARGGETLFADLEAGYAALRQAMRDDVDGLSAIHSLVYGQAKLGHTHRAGSEFRGYGMVDAPPPPRRALVKAHPETGRKSLVIGRYAHAVSGRTDAESEALMQYLLDFACQAPRIWSHAWTPGDVIVWDNRRVAHRVAPWDMGEPRVMWHSRLAGDPVADGP